MAPMYYRGANAAVIVYDITAEESLDEVKVWLDGQSHHSLLCPSERASKTDEILFLSALYSVPSCFSFALPPLAYTPPPPPSWAH